MERITIEDVAARAGVSPTTVSHVFSGRRPVNEATRNHVRRVAEQLGYRANAVASSLRTQRTNTVMIVLPDLTNPFYPVFARGVQDTLRAGGYHTLICNTDSLEAEERAFLEDAMSRRVDGVVFAGFWVPPEDLLVLTNAGMAVTNLGQGLGDVDSILSGDIVAVGQMTEYLAGKYGSDLALIDGPENTLVAQARAHAFVMAAPGRHEIVSEEFTRDGGRRGMRRLLDGPHPPRAVFCANDLLALGALDVARERRLAVPADIAVAGYDDIEAASLVQPSLTTVRNRSYDLGVAGGELLLSRMTGNYSGDGRTVLVQAEIVVRESA